MKKIIVTSCILATIVVGGFALAQQVPSPTSSTKLILLQVDAKDIELIGEGLGTLPYARVAPLMQRLQGQINEQMKPPVVAPPTPPAEK